MGGAPWQCGTLAHRLRVSLWAEHLGLFNEEGQVSQEGYRSIADPVQAWSLWCTTSASNTIRHGRLFPYSMPSSDVRTFKDMMDGAASEAFGVGDEVNMRTSQYIASRAYRSSTPMRASRASRASTVQGEWLTREAAQQGQLQHKAGRAAKHRRSRSQLALDHRQTYPSPADRFSRARRFSGDSIMPRDGEITGSPDMGSPAMGSPARLDSQQRLILDLIRATEQRRQTAQSRRSTRSETMQTLASDPGDSFPSTPCADDYGEMTDVPPLKGHLFQYPSDFLKEEYLLPQITRMHAASVLPSAVFT